MVPVVHIVLRKVNRGIERIFRAIGAEACVITALAAKGKRNVRGLGIRYIAEIQKIHIIGSALLDIRTADRVKRGIIIPCGKPSKDRACDRYCMRVSEIEAKIIR